VPVGTCLGIVHVSSITYGTRLYQTSENPLKAPTPEGRGTLLLRTRVNKARGSEAPRGV
jgi:hypothetical protein